LPMWFQRLVGSSSSKGHPAHVSSLRAQAPGLVCGQLSENDRVWRVRSSCPGFPVAFRLPPFASWPSCPATDVRSPCGRPTGWLVFSTGPVTGFPCSALVRCGRCRTPPIPRDRGALVADIETSATTAASQRRVLFFGGTPSPEILGNEACGGSRPFALPAFPLPVTDGWSIGPWAFSRASHPTVASDACQERGRALSTHSELTVEHSRPSISVISLTTVRPHVAPRCPSVLGPRPPGPRVARRRGRRR